MTLCDSARPIDLGQGANKFDRPSVRRIDDQQCMTFELPIPLVAFRESTTNCDPLTIV